MTRRGREVAVTGAPVLFVLLWSTGFVGAKYGLPYAEPFTFLAMRLALAGVLLAGLVLVTRSPWPTGDQAVRAGVAGVLLHGGYLGGVFYGISVGVPAGVAAVVVSLQPVLTAALATRLLGERLRPVQWLGFAAGLTGVGLVLAPGLAASVESAGRLPVVGVAACVVALAAGTAGTLYQKQHGDRTPLLSGTSVQYAGATVPLLALALVVEDRTVQWAPEFVAAFAWLVVALSLGAVLLLLFLLRRGTAGGVSSLFFLVPPATAVEAYLLFGEALRPLGWAGVALTAAGVAMVMRGTGPATAAAPRRG